MKLRLHQNSLFAILLRSGWWVSALLAVGTFGAVRLILPPGYAAFAALPFIVIAGIVAWKQLRTPSGARLAAALDQLRGMSWEEFSVRLEEGFRRDGCTVSRVNAAAADFEVVTRERRLALVGCKRWKASRVGVAQLRELKRAAEERSADSIYVCAGELTDNAREFAARNGIRLLRDAELVKLAAGG